MTTYPSAVDIPTNPQQRRIWVSAQLRMRGTSQRAIARQLGVTQQSVSEALMRPSSRIERAIAEAIGVTVEQLFPERFAPDGTRLMHTRAPHPTTPANPCNVDHEEAA